MIWHLYILRCADGSLYTGVTRDLSRRLRQHRSGQGARYTQAKGPVRLVYRERHMTQHEALSREAQIKRWTRAKKLALAAHRMKRLKDLARSRD